MLGILQVWGILRVWVWGILRVWGILQVGYPQVWGILQVWVRVRLVFCLVGRQLLRSVGNFFGVTETSQRGGDGHIGWEQFNERNYEVRTHRYTRTHARTV